MIEQGAIGGDVKRPYGGTDATLFLYANRRHLPQRAQTFMR